MLVVRRLAIAVVALVGMAFAVGFAVPRSWHVERTIVIAAPPEKTFALLANLHRWQDWSVWTRELDPQVRNTFEGPESGVGARWSWLGPKMGRGQLEITAADPLVGLELAETVGGTRPSAFAVIALSATPEGGTRLTWSDDGNLPLLGGAFTHVTEQLLGQQISTSLERLKARLEDPRQN